MGWILSDDSCGLDQLEKKLINFRWASLDVDQLTMNFVGRWSTPDELGAVDLLLMNLVRG